MRLCIVLEPTWWLVRMSLCEETKEAVPSLANLAVDFCTCSSHSSVNSNPYFFDLLFRSNVTESHALVGVEEQKGKEKCWQERKCPFHD